MERIFPNLYRFSFGKRGRSCTCLLVRRQGNLLICHCDRGSSVTRCLDEIERLGGIGRQFSPTAAGQIVGRGRGVSFLSGSLQEELPRNPRRKSNQPP